MQRVRHELHHGRLVRCFEDRPASVTALVEAVASAHPAREALVSQSERLTYRALQVRVGNVAGNLAAAGIGTGDRVALLLGNQNEFVIALLACARIRAIAVPMSCRQRAPETELLVNDCGAKAIVVAAEYAGHLPARARIPAVERVFVTGDPGGSGDPFARLLRTRRAPDVVIGEDDVFCILYTSGTTGRPKGAMLTHFGVLHSLMHFREHLGLGEHDECAVLAVPAAHVTGAIAIILTMLACAGRIVMLASFKAKAFLELAERERMTFNVLVPAMYNLCLLEQDLARFDLSAWRIGVFGGAPMPQASIASLAEKLPGLQLVNAYGATEVSSPATFLHLDRGVNRSDSVGRSVACGDIRIMSATGHELAPGVSGEVWIAGPMVVPGYWNDAAATAAAFQGGYWRSGDIGTRDAQGYLRILDRAKDMINRAGYKVYSAEVENVLSQHPDVIECAVVPHPDAVFGEKVHAYLFMRAGCGMAYADLREFCAPRLSAYKIPDFLTVTSAPLPRNSNGKLLKSRMREWLLASLSA